MIKNINIKTRARTEFVDITSRVIKELFHIKKKIFIINSKPTIMANIESVLSLMWQKKGDRLGGI